MLFNLLVLITMGLAVPATPTLTTDKGCANALHGDVKRVRLAKLDTETIIKIIRALSVKFKLDVNPKAMQTPGLGDEAYFDAIFATVNQRFSKVKVYNDATLGTGKSWRWWQEQAGLDPDVVNKRVERLKAELIPLAIKALHDAGYDIFEAAMTQYNDDEKAREIIFKATGRRLFPSKITFDATDRYKKKWDWWVAQAGLTLDGVPRLHRRLTDLQIIAAIQVLNENKFLIDYISMKANASNAEASAIILAQTSVRLNTTQLRYEATNFHQRSWSAWLELAGFDSQAIQAQSPHRGLGLTSPDKIVTLIQTFAELKLPVNYEAFAENWNLSPESSEVIRRIVGKAILPSTILTTATQFHNQQWDWWLVKAGLNPLDIRLRSGRGTYNLLSASMKRELATNYNALTDGLTVGYSNMQPVVAKAAPQEIQVDQQKVAREFEKFYSILEARQVLLLDSLLDYFSFNDQFDLHTLADYASGRSETHFSIEEVQELFAIINKNPTLRVLL